MTQPYTFDNILDIIESEITALKFKRQPESLFEPISYILSLGGKRVRPALALMACNLFQENASQALPVALGIEVFHNFTLLHDDLMDRADMRRSKPTVHMKWNDNAAILSGDAMVIEAYREISKVSSDVLKPILEGFSDTATEICCGQQLDIEFENRLDVSVEEYIEMIRLKTAVLLGYALKGGAIVAQAKDKDINALYDFGINLGLAFQLKDDLLDVYGDEKSFGKKIGGDIACNKKTYLLINALANKGVYDELITWIEKTSFDRAEKVNAVTEIYNKLGLKEKTEVLIEGYYKKALQNLSEVEVDATRKEQLMQLAEKMMFRNS